jgi:hypothetical protein
VIGDAFQPTEILLKLLVILGSCLGGPVHHLALIHDQIGEDADRRGQCAHGHKQRRGGGSERDNPARCPGSTGCRAECAEQRP